jgi:ketosteroid isomerase-like protein
MSANKDLIEKFYAAFQNRDYKTMAACYHPDAYFRDQAFELKGKQIAAMWHMLCERGADLELAYSVSENNGVVSAHWEPKYTFSQTGRLVHNIIDAEFEFKDEMIIKHIDHFDFWRWSRQSLGAPGLLLGWTSFLKNKVARIADKSLTNFIKAHAEYA